MLFPLLPCAFAVLAANDVGTALQEAGVPRAQLEEAVKEVSGVGHR